ncbi:MAG TPA: NAD(P)/FAD-dependent oxidoreductase [Vicinamibacterales bacterium]|nr:NAD(P)/FAD-dependent oxidoreductase [Vicinamibacterales bacterium]
MDTCDVLVVGGGPAGSACAWRLRQAGLDVVVVDKALFPRDKVCAGWITPQVIDELQIDAEDYRRGRTFQPITGFRVGLIGGAGAVETAYDRPVSFGIRRCEFDHYLLRRSNARVLTGTPVSSIRRDEGRWVVNETFETAMLVGAGGHFCPVARLLNGSIDRTMLIAAQEVELPIGARDASSVGIAGERPELYFCPDLKGYGWCFRKENHLNVGFGRLDARALPAATAEFVDFLTARHAVPALGASPWRGHAYLLSGSSGRCAVADGAMLIGDSAGLAYPQSGEGIRPAIESGLMAADTIVQAQGRYARGRLAPYERAIRRRFGAGPVAEAISRMLPAGARTTLAPRLLGIPWFVRQVALERWFLHAQEPPLARPPESR